MKTALLPLAGLSMFLACLRATAQELVVDDPDGALATVVAPVAVACNLSPEQRRAATAGRLFLRETGRNGAVAVPAQIFPVARGRDDALLCWLMLPGTKGRRAFRLEIQSASDAARVTAERNPEGQFDVREEDRSVLRYNYALIEPGALLDQIKPADRLYARARSDYIHPLFGLRGEALTRDWPLDHPHHRGIYWAWPEVDWRGERGDLHALQKVFARPVGRCFTQSGPVFAELIAENLWKWEDAEPIVQERAVIRAYRATEAGRVLDLEFQFTALREPVLLARRGTDKYGGLNLRFAPVEGQQIATRLDPSNAEPRMAWAEIAGRFGGASEPAGVVILQHISNPRYPGDWVQFPKLNWLQPTFPTAGERWELKPGCPLVLRYRLWLHPDGPASEERCAGHWRAYQSALTPKFFPESALP